jgi:PAS domain S-box-containing protein
VPDTKKLLAAITDEQRLRALQATGLLDSAPEAAFDRFTKLATKLLKVPMALISLVDDQRQFFKSAAGLGAPLEAARGTPLTHSVCKHVVANKKPLVVSDARTNYELRGNRAVEELGVVAYAGMPLVDQDDNALGAFCAVDTQPRHWSDDDLEILRELASATMIEIALRREVQARSESDAFTKAVFDGIDVGLIAFDLSRRITWANSSAEWLFGYGPGELPGRRLFDLLDPSDRELDRALHSELSDRARSRVTHERRMKRKDGSWIWIRRTLTRLPADAQDKGVVLAAIEEIQDHKQLAEQLQQSEQRYRAVVRSLPGCALLTFDRDLRYTMAEGEQLLGAANLSVSRVLGRTIRDLTMPVYARRLEQVYRAALRGETHVIEMPHDGRFYTVQVAPLGDGGLALISDSTESRRTADALDQQTGLFRLLSRIASETMRAGSGWSILRACLQILCQELQLPVGHVFLVEGESLSSTALWHVDDPLTRRPFVSATTSTQLGSRLCLPGRALEAAGPVASAELARDPDFLRAGPAASSGLSMGLALPIRGGGRMVAVVECFDDRVRPVTTMLLDALAVTAALLGRVVERGPLVPD